MANKETNIDISTLKSLIKRGDIAKVAKKLCSTHARISKQVNSDPPNIQEKVAATFVIVFRERRARIKSLNKMINNITK